VLENLLNRFTLDMLTTLLQLYLLTKLIIESVREEILNRFTLDMLTTLLQLYLLTKLIIFRIILIIFIQTPIYNGIGGEKLDFLDVTIIKNNNKLEFDWFHKSTFSSRYLNFYSQHPLIQKRGTVINMTDRAFLLSEISRKNLHFVVDILLNNDYSLNFIFDTINRRLNYHFKKHVRSKAIITRKMYIYIGSPFLTFP